MTENAPVGQYRVQRLVQGEDGEYLIGGAYVLKDTFAQARRYALAQKVAEAKSAKATHANTGMPADNTVYFVVYDDTGQEVFSTNTTEP